MDVARLLAPPSRAGVVLDFDGTLSPIVARPELASIEPGARQELARLHGRYGLVAVVSGRARAELEDLVGVAGVRCEGLYGLGPAPPVSEEVLDRVRDAAAAVPGAWVDHKGISVAVHFRQARDPAAAAAALAPALKAIAATAGLEIAPGKRVLELVPALMPRKGAAVERLVAEAELDAVLYAGDDLADLDAFEELDRLAGADLRTVKVVVGGDETPAELEAAGDLVVKGPAGLLALLRSL